MLPIISVGACAHMPPVQGAPLALDLLDARADDGHGELVHFGNLSPFAFGADACVKAPSLSQAQISDCGNEFNLLLCLNVRMLRFSLDPPPLEPFGGIAGHLVLLELFGGKSGHSFHPAGLSDKVFESQNRRVCAPIAREWRASGKIVVKVHGRPVDELSGWRWWSAAVHYGRIRPW